MTAPRVLILNSDGTATVGGVKCKLVPEKATGAIMKAVAGVRYDASLRGSQSSFTQDWQAALSAAAIDLSGLPRVPTTHGFDGVFAAGMQHVLDAIGVPK